MKIVVKAKYIDGYRIWLQFNDGKSGVVDLSDELWGDVFEPLLELENFRNFKFGEGHDTIFWDHGADFAPEFLYEKMVIQNLLV
jgi:hypothetical protein